MFERRFKHSYFRLVVIDREHRKRSCELLFERKLIQAYELEEQPRLLRPLMSRIPYAPTCEPIQNCQFQATFSNFSSQVGEHALNQWEQTFAQHLFLLARWRLSQHTSSQRLLPLDEHSSLRWLLLLRLLGWHWCLGRLGWHDWCACYVTPPRGVLEVGPHTCWVDSIGWHSWTGSCHSSHVHGHGHWAWAHGTTSSHHFVVLMPVLTTAHLWGTTCEVGLHVPLALLGPTGHTSWSHTLRLSTEEPLRLGHGSW